MGNVNKLLAKDLTFYRGEGTAIQSVRRLLGKDATAIADHSRQIRQLIRIAVNIEGIRNTGEAEKHKATFKNQAAALMASLDVSNNTEVELRTLTNTLSALVHESDNITKLVADEITKLNQAATGTGSLTTEDSERFGELRKTLAQLVVATQSVDAIQFHIKDTIKPITQTTRVGQLIADATTNFADSGNFATALTNLQAALSEREAEVRIIQETSELVTRANALIGKQRSLIDGIATQLRLDKAPNITRH